MVFATKIALDTNIVLHRKKWIKIAREKMGDKSEIVIPIQVKQELLAMSGKSKAQQAKIQQLLEELKSIGIREKKVGALKADDALLQLSKEGFLVLTLDRKLKKEIQRQQGLVLNAGIKELE